MPRFAILEHDHPFLHWDFLLETGDQARTFRLLARPVLGQIIPAEPLGGHRLLYLDYEGPVSGGRGSVKRWDVGTFSWEEDSPQSLAVLLQGQRLRGRARMSSRGERWSFVLESNDTPRI
jgi:hypothetical protein